MSLIMIVTLVAVLAEGLFWSFVPVGGMNRVLAAPDPIKICIDPGHGGENLGADHNGYLEKEMTLIVAESMRDELSKYEGIEVYMTRTEDVDMSLEERVDYAEEVGADFFFCLHFNMSAEHDMYGAECWISAFGEEYARGMDFAEIEMRQLTDLGLYDRGIKTRLNDSGTNYYGVLRMADLAGIPGIIIEHCHLDNYNDEPYYDHHDLLVKYGILDATSVAMYYGLRSEELGVDYSGYTYDPTPVPDSVMRPDNSEPFIQKVNYGNPYVTQSGAWIDVELTASDPDCRMLYYSYSTDGGVNWSERYRWQDDQGSLIGDAGMTDTIHTTLPLSYERDMYVIFRVYNLYNLDVESAPYFIEKVPTSEEEVEEYISHSTTGTVATPDGSDGGMPAYSEVARDEEPADVSRTDDGIGTDKAFLAIVVILASAILAVVAILGYVIYDHQRNARKRRRRK